MVILPAQLALKSGTEGQIGLLEKADTNAPEFVVETTEVGAFSRQTSVLLISTLSHFRLEIFGYREHFGFLVSLSPLRQHSSRSCVSQSEIKVPVKMFLILHSSSRRLVKRL